MIVREIGDPRLQELFGAEAAAGAGVRPVVRLPRDGPPRWLIGAFIAAAALLLFGILESRRQVQPAPEVRERGPGTALFSPEPPPLYIPPAPPPQQPAVTALAPAVVPVPAPAPRTFVHPEPQIIYQQPLPQPTPPSPQMEQPRTSAGPALVIDTSGPAGAQNSAPGPAAAGAAQSLWGGRARAGALANRSDTVAQGALIPAVLETAFNSTSPGLARAIVSRDVRGFDGTRVLIPRGSRLIGEYASDVAPGQKRALITWTRLIRPDGTTIALDSPATDTLGRGGVRARVNTHFWERFGDALMRTTVDIGAGIARRRAGDTVVVALPGTAQGTTAPTGPATFAPTLSISAGTSISVFVARDLEFPGSGRRG